MIDEFKDRVALITGGSSGIGLATATLLLHRGASVAIVGSTAEKGQAALAALNHAGQAIFIQGDVSQPAECKQIVQQTISHFGKLDIVVNSAGVYLEKAIDDVSEEDYQTIMDVNIKGTFFICKYAVPELKKANGGAIINVSSDAGINGNVLCTAYCASKGAVTTFTKALSLELALHHIRVNCVCPGDIETPMLKKQLAASANPEALLREMTSIYPMCRIGQASEVAEVISFLASKKASLITGVVLPVDGGLTAC
ncbi:short-chain dehydrogenase [Sporomusaceae bacterium FL31]|nr:short-chain dehydrogenase [Sporomusaceae bacterium FL31]GCE35257.1 short-chain dehydrogenase [Sporomusaceae bacterium]